MRWHVEIAEQGTPQHVEHVETLDVARETAAGYVRDLKGKGLPEEQVSKLYGQVQQEVPDEVDTGLDWTWHTAVNGHTIEIRLGAMPEGQEDPDCMFCS